MKTIAQFIILFLPVFVLASESVKIPKTAPDDLSGYAQGEAMIAKSEEQALVQLEKLLKKYKGSYQEPDLLYRQAELYMRRAKAGRFFDLYRDDKKVASVVPPKLSQGTAKSYVQKAVSIYEDILKRYPKYSDTDAVLFNKAFAHNQLGEISTSVKLYTRLLNEYQNSPLVPESLVALGELLYDSQKFEEALIYFDRVQKFPNFKMYPFSVYKSAWCLYNLQKTKEAIKRLEEILGLQPYLNDQALKSKYDLRSEAIRDLTIYYGDVGSAEDAVPYFSKILHQEEVGPALIQMTKIYDAHSRQKEIIIILENYVKKFPLDDSIMDAYLMLAESYDLLKQRESSVNTIGRMHDLCKINSPWLKMNKTQESGHACEKKLPDYTLDVAKRWWELWNKNKSSSEVSKATQKVFQFHLSSEKGKKDFQNRYAYAELLFQNSMFLDAADQYEEVSKNIENKLIAHDAAYAATVCIDKLIEKEPKLKSRLLADVEYYVDKFPEGKYSVDLQIKRAQLLIDDQNRLKAEEIIKLVLSNKKITLSANQRKISEDIYISLLFQRKEYAMVKERSFQAMKQEQEPIRKSKLLQIYKESQLLLIEALEKSNKELEAAHLYLSFWEEHKDKDLAIASLWKAVSLFFANGREFEGAETAWKYSLVSTDKNKVEKALDQALKAYLSVGQLKKAAMVQESILKDKKMDEKFDDYLLIAEFYDLDGAKNNAEKIYSDLYNISKKEKRVLLTQKLLDFFKEDPKNLKLKQVQSDILSNQIEPFYTNKKLEDLRSELKASAFNKAFESARKIMSSDGNSEQKAEARLAQAYILELEHNSQSVKSSLDRLPVVLSLKTEKLDKASTSYSQALKTSQNARFQLQALEGLKRVYNNYVSSISNLTVTSEISEADLAAVKSELKNLTDPISDKEKEVSEKLTSLSSQIDTSSSNTGFENLGFSQSYLHPVSLPQLEELKPYVPSWPDPKRWLAVTAIPSSTCSEKSLDSRFSYTTLAESANKCLKAKKWELLEKIGYELLIKEPRFPWGAFYLAEAAANKNQLDRAEWFYNLAISKESNSALLYYQRGRLALKDQNYALARPDFQQAVKLDLQIYELRLYRGLQYYQMGKFLESVDDLTMVLPSDVGSKENILIALSECYTKQGNYLNAVSLLESYLKKAPSVIIWLEKARIQESQKLDKDIIKATYTEALKLSKNDSQRAWIEGKLKYLQTLPK